MADEPKTEEERVTLLQTLADELELQAWLAEAELRNPSEHDEVNALAQLRDELRLQMHLGTLEARDEFDKIEQAWRDVKSQVAKAADQAEAGLNDLLRGIRDGYKQLTERANAD